MYATLEQMQNMEFGNGNVVTIQGVMFERLSSGELFGWAARNNDVDGNMIDWDHVSEEEAKTLGLIK
jgi:hypothetical protein